MRYCPDCGTPHECEAENGREKSEVAIVRLQTQRDIEVARINAAAAKTIAETEAENSSDRAEGIAEGMETALDAVAGGPEEPEGEPIVVEAEPDGEPEPEPGPDNEPPVVEVSEPAAPRSRGWWDGYR